MRTLPPLLNHQSRLPYLGCNFRDYTVCSLHCDTKKITRDLYAALRALRWKDIDVLLQARDLGGWKNGGLSEARGVKPMVAELVAALGTDCVSRLCLDIAAMVDD